jgi:hypothetical protein
MERFILTVRRQSAEGGEGPDDRMGQSCLGLDESIALAILPWQALGRQSAVKPQRERPAHDVIAWDELIEPLYAGPACTVVWQGPRGDSPPYADLWLSAA